MSASDAGVKAVVFDVGRVIVQWDLAHLLSKCVADPVERDWVARHVVTEHWHFQHDAGRPLAEMVPERKALFPRHAGAIDHYANNFLDSIPGPVPGSAELIARLASREVPLFAITNFGVDFWQQFRPTCDALDHMLDIVVSGEERVAKPEPQIFRIAEARFGYRAGEMLFIDDNLANVGAARGLGWQVHHFRDAPSLEADLAARGLL